jgi:hypothetical protein
VPQKFEEIFSKYDSGNKGGLTWDDVQALVKGNMNVNDFVGWCVRSPSPDAPLCRPPGHCPVVASVHASSARVPVVCRAASAVWTPSSQHTGIARLLASIGVPHQIAVQHSPPFCG